MVDKKRANLNKDEPGLNHSKTYTEHVRKVMEAMMTNQSTSQKGNANSGKGLFPKAPHVSEEEFRKEYKAPEGEAKELL